MINRSLFLLTLTGLFLSRLVFAAAETQTGTMLLFMETEKNIDPYPSRFIVTDNFIRIDDGENSVDFVLFDRKKQLVYSVTEENRSIMIVEQQNVQVEPPVKLSIKSNSLGEMQDAPKIEGVVPHHYQFIVNDKVCYEYVALAGVMEDVVVAMKEFSTVLASDSKLTVNTVPADMQDACSLAAHSFAPGFSLKQGFPLQEWNKDEYSRMLVDYNKNFKLEPQLFILPEGFRRFTVQQVRGAE